MLLFLIPVLILVGATSIGIGAEISQSQPPPAQPTVQPESRPAPPPAPAPTRVR
ncbi:MAG TPA: hypothetical protein VK540_22445 [Polyangiaceae bacterium]|nr:hypothetical protein [Polyangiaceae bacterium]